MADVIVGILISGVVVAAIYWLYRAAEVNAALGQTDAALRVERERVATMESAAADQRKERARELDAEAASVATASDAADFLRDRLTWSHPPQGDELRGPKPP